MKRGFSLGISIVAALAGGLAGGLSIASAQQQGGQRANTAEAPEQQYGWQNEPRQIDPETLQRPMSELERLSRSSSGLRYGRDAYDPRSDNPLEPVSVTLRALDKITARYTDLVIDMDAEAKFGTLSIVPRTCDKRPPEEVPEITAFLEITATDDFTRLPTSDGSDPLGRDVAPDTTPLIEEKIANNDGAGLALPDDDDMVASEASFSETDARTGGLTDEDNDGDNTLFSGWMFASSPALNALEHPVYDVWVVDCRMVDPAI